MITFTKNLALVRHARIVPLLGLLLIHRVEAASFTNATPLIVRRYYHTATLLPNGKVLVAGGVGTNGSMASAELYDPATGTSVATGSLTNARSWHTATLLMNGKVLVVGGADSVYRTSAELYDPATGKWTLAGSLNTARGIHTATLLPNGRVLVVGGAGISSGKLVSAEVSQIPPRESGRTPDRWPMAAMGIPRRCFQWKSPWWRPVSTDNSSLFPSAELYDPATGLGAPGPGRCVFPTIAHTATLLPNGKVLAAGGSGNEYSKYLSTTRNSRSRHRALDRDRCHDQSTRRSYRDLLPNGRVLVVGGAGYNTATNTADLYDPATEPWTDAGLLNVGRDNHTATLCQRPGAHCRWFQQQHRRRRQRRVL